MRLLLTRPREDAVALAEALSRLGHEAILAPLMEVQTLAGPPLALDGVSAVLATSANGIRALSARSARRDLPVFAVGPQTASAARQAGYANIIDASGNSTALIETVARRANPAAGVLVHAAGKETAGSVQHNLEARGFRVETLTLYDAVPVARLPAEASHSLRDGPLDGVMLFSPRSAKLFAGLVEEAGLARHARKLTAYCISAATAAGLAPLVMARVAIARAANQEAMLALLQDGSPDLPPRSR